MRRTTGTLILAFCLTGPVTAQDLRLPLRGGEPDLALFVLSSREARISAAGWQLLRMQGFLHENRGAFLQPLSSGQSLVPTLRHDPNINSGIPSDHITLGGLRFRVSEDSRAKDALLAGLRYSSWVSYSYAPAARLRVSQSWSVESEPTYGYHQAAIRADICAEHPVAGWTWLDACLSGDAAYNGTETGYRLYGGLTARKVFDTVLGTQQAKFTAGRIETGDYGKTVLQLDSALLTTHAGMWRLGLAWGERVDGENTLRQSISLDWSGVLAGRHVNLGLRETRTDGGALFGLAREDRRTRLHLTVPVNRIDIGAHAEYTRSTIDAYRGIAFGVNIRFRVNLL